MKKYYLLMLLAFVVFIVNTANATDRLVPSPYATIQDAMDAAAPGDNIIIAAGTYTLPAQVLLNKANITIMGAGNTSTIIQVSGTGERFYITASGVTIKDLQIQKTDKAGVQNIIYIGGNNTTIKNNIIWGQFVIGDGDVSRAMVITGGLTGLQIEGNTIHNLRQPAYMSGPTTGNILNNYVYLTKGWVMEGGDVTFTGNTWGTGANSNVYDIAILSAAPPTAYTDIVAMSNANNGAVIEDQRVSPAVLSVVYVDASTSFTSDLGGRYHPYSTITPGITRVVSGGKILVAAGTYSETVLINKSIILKGMTGQMTNTMIQAPTSIPPASDPLSSIIIISGFGVNVEISGLTIQGPGPSGCGSIGRGIFIRDGANANIHNNQILNIRDNPFSGCQNGIGIQVGRNYWTTSGTATITNNLIQGYQKGGIVVDNTGSNADISGNTITGAGTTTVIAQNGIQISRGATATLTSNIVSGNSFHLTGNASDWGSCGVLLYQSSTVSFNGGNNLSNNDQNVYLSGVSGAVTFGSEIIGPSTAPLTFGYYITNNSNQNINVQSCTFEGISPLSATLAQLFSIEDKIWSSVDDQTYTGLVRIKNSNVFITHTESGAKIQYGIDAASTGDIVNVAAGIYNESININKTLTLSGENRDNVIIKGPKTIGQTVILSSGCTLEKVTVTRDGNNVTDWATNANTSGVIFAQGIQNVTLQNVKVTENRNGVYINNSQGNTIRNCLITNNRTGVQLVNDVSNTLIENNDITNNWTVGFVVYYAGVLTPTTNCTVRNNTISGNWYSGTDCKTVNANPTISYNFANNWWGTPILNVVTTPAGEPGYVAQIPVQFGGTAVPPGGNEGKISGDLSAKINYTPWKTSIMVGTDINIPVSVTPAPIPLPNCGATIQFTHLGSNNVNPTITIEKYIGLAGTPASAGAPIPVYFKITATNLVNYTFEATIVLDITGITDFNANTVVLYSPNGTSWTGANGTYNAGTNKYTFTTNHFSYIAFTNPTLSNEINLYVSTSTSAYSNTVYPNIGWNTPLSTGSGDAFNWDPTQHSHDWTYKVKNGTFYIIPVGSISSPRSFNAATIKLMWNPIVVSGISVTEGNFFNQGGKATVFTTSSGANWVIIDASCLEQNQTPDGSKYIAKLDFAFNGTESGFSPIVVDAVTLLYMDGSSEYEVTTVTQNMGGKMKCYLGDFASPSSLDMGDGLITGTDLNIGGFSSAYWSSYTNPSLYRSKFDVGPTTPSRYYFGKPVPDGTIGFEDLAIFAMGYSKTGSGTLPDNPKPVIFALDKISGDGLGTLRLPVKISGNVNDVRAFSMKIRHGSDIEYKGIEMAGEMMEGTKFLTGKDESSKAFVDGASFDANALSREGIIAYVLFNEKISGNHNVSIESAIARNSGNLDIDVSFDGMNTGVGVPTSFSLSQNYPNPFNPVTKIEYALPNDTKVSIKIYDMVGREVSVLVNDMQKAGYYKLDWNGSSLASGAYFYRMVAGDFVAVKKMMLIK